MKCTIAKVLAPNIHIEIPSISHESISGFEIVPDSYMMIGDYEYYSAIKEIEGNEVIIFLVIDGNSIIKICELADPDKNNYQAGFILIDDYLKDDSHLGLQFSIDERFDVEQFSLSLGKTLQKRSQKPFSNGEEKDFATDIVLNGHSGKPAFKFKGSKPVDCFLCIEN